jgi:hypothetical protein
VDDAKLTATAKDAVQTVRTRLENGRQKGAHEGKLIKELLETLTDNTRKNAGPLYEEAREDPPKNYYLHEPEQSKISAI